MHPVLHLSCLSPTTFSLTRCHNVQDETDKKNLASPMSFVRAKIPIACASRTPSALSSVSRSLSAITAILHSDASTVPRRHSSCRHLFFRPIFRSSAMDYLGVEDCGGGGGSIEIEMYLPTAATGEGPSERGRPEWPSST